MKAQPTDAQAPFRVPGLPVDAPRREAAATRVLRAGWASALAALADGAASLREAPSPWLAFSVEVGSAVRRAWPAALLTAILLVLMWIFLFGVVLQFPPAYANARGLLRDGVTSLAIVLGVFAATAVGAVAALGAAAAARVVAGVALIAGSAAAAAALRFVGASAREVVREVARRAYDTEVERARTRVRVAAVEERPGADASGARPPALEGPRDVGGPRLVAAGPAAQGPDGASGAPSGRSQ
jgi:hypothetical protein